MVRQLLLLALVFPALPLAAVEPTGAIHLTFTDRSPFSPIDEMCKREPFKSMRYTSYRQGDEEGAKKFLQLAQYDLAGESFEAFVPRNYKPDGTFGLLVWISPSSAGIPNGWQDILIRRKLIYISANDTGNDRYFFIRTGLALDALYNASQRYTLDKKRIYIAGFSGGGEKASYLLTGFPDLFTGGFFIMGYSFYGGRLNETKHWDADLSSARWEGPIEEIKKNTRIVIVSGEKDNQTFPGADLADYNAFLLDGFERVTLLQTPFPHALPTNSWIDRAVVALDQSAPKKPPTTGPTTQPNPLPGQIAQAKRILTSAQVNLDMQQKGMKSAGKLARKYLQQVIDDYPTTPSAIKARALLDAMTPATKPQS